MEFELDGWKVKLGLVALALLVVAVPLARANHANKGRAEGWHRRAVVAEESVGGLRVVIAQRSRALNQRTLQANQLVNQLDSKRTALHQSKVNVGALTRRERALVKENAKVKTENAKVKSEGQKLRTQQARLKTIATKLSACTKDLGGALSAAQTTKVAKAAKPGAKQGTTDANAGARIASCARVSASLDAFLGGLP
jgi:chromosome segregation ATPase